MRRLIYIFITLISYTINAQEEGELKRCADGTRKVECGWHYGFIDPLGELETPKKDKDKELPKIIITAEPEEKETCTNKDNWTEDCGFVDPGEDFDFQAMQRDIFLKGLLMKSGDPKAVKNMQRYQRWLVSKAVEASKMWEFNLVNDPTLSASIENPVTSFGLQMTTQLRKDTSQAVLDEIYNEGGMFVWFTRSDCPYCHKQGSMIASLQKYEDFKIRNVSLDEICMPNFEADCIKAPFSEIPASKLNVNVVPSIYVFMPKDNTWIRVSNGLESIDTIKRRVKNFFLAVKSAHINGINNGYGITPSVDFKGKESRGLQGYREIKGIKGINNETN